jgi:hypothetical protein
MNSEMLRQICSSLATVTEDIKWGNDLVFCVASPELLFRAQLKFPTRNLMS